MTNSPYTRFDYSSWSFDQFQVLHVLLSPANTIKQTFEQAGSHRLFGVRMNDDPNCCPAVCLDVGR